jgi:peptide/nickel transport system permease protein
MLLLAFAYWLPWLPAGGMTDVILHDYMAPGPAAWDRARHLVLPVLSLTLVIAATVARYQRASLLEVLPADWVRTARAKGVAESAVLFRHALRNAMIPILTVAGIQLGQLMAGSIILESVFYLPGLGLLVTNAVASRDYAVVLAAVIAGGVMVVVGNLLADIGYGLADPRVRVS